MSDWNLPTVNDTYTNYLAYLKNRDLDLAKGMDPAFVTVTNPVANMIRWNSVNSRWETYNGSSWVILDALYEININGNAATATAWATGRTITLTGDVTGASGAWTGSANISFAATLATVTAAKGGTGQAGGYAIGDILYASGASALSKLADVATGNVLLSGGVGVAPAYGKVTLTGHVSGILPVANGGLNLSGYTTGDILYASGTDVMAKLAAAAAGNVLISGATPSWAKVGLTTHVSGILPAANGGTGNAYVAFTGPTIARSYTLPDANATLLYSGGPLGTPSSGNLANCTFPTLNQSTSGNAATATTANALNTANDYQMDGLGVGTAPSATSGEIRATNNITAYYSDIRLKRITGYLSGALDKVAQLNPFTYYGNDLAKKYGFDTKRHQIGVSAQEIQRVVPEAVFPAPFDTDGAIDSVSGENYLTVQYEKLVPLLIEAIKELHGKVSVLSVKLEEHGIV